MVINELICETVKKLKENKNENPIFEANLIVRTILKLSPLDIILKGKTEVNEDEILQIYNITERRILGEPLQYILGTQEFMGLEFLVNPSVLIPRSDTEILVEHVLEHFSNKPVTVLDLCTGSGCIAISFAHFNINSYVTGIDISSDAIKTAQKNAELLGVSDRVTFQIADVFNMNLFGKFDLIISNPPYIEKGVIPTLSKTVREYEPLAALDGGDDGLDFYRHIISIAPKYLVSGGMLAFEIGYNQKDAVLSLMEKSFSDIRSIKDFGNNDRVISGIFKNTSQI